MIALAGTSALAAALVPAQARAQVICDSGVGTEVGFEETLEGNSDTLGGIYDLRTTDFGGTVFAGTLVVNGGGAAPLDITTERGLVRLEFGDIEIAEGACVVSDRLVIDRAQVTVRAGALLGGNTGLLATSIFPDGGVGGTDVIGSTVNFTPGSEVLFGSPWNLLGTSTLSLDLDNAGNPDSAIFSKLSGGPFSTLEVAAGTTMTIARSAGDAGTFLGTLAGDGAINVTFGFGGTATWTVRPSESTFSGNVVVDNYMTLVAEDLGPASLSVGPRGRAFASGVLGSLEVSDFIGATDPSENVSTLGARLGINADGTPGRLDVTGNVTLSPLTVLTMNLGAPGGAPGVDSDLITVGGNLTLDGVLLVEDAGGFGFGLYRLFTYGGALNDGSLEVVGVPTGFSILDFDVSTAISGQVNLLVGDQGGGEEPPEIAMFPADADTLGPNDYDPATTVIFAGAGREIAIDGTVERGPGGLQFADDDFELDPAAGGGSFFLPGTDIEINVGDGTAAGAGFTGTIGADIAGLGGITKTGLGTLVLAGNNSFAGGITMVDGTLQGTTASLTGVIDFGSIDIEQRILSTTVIITGGAGPQLNVTALGGNYRLVGGVFEAPLDAPFVPDRLVISDSTVTVGSGATFGTRLSPFAPGTIFADGGLAGTELVNSTVNFAAGSTVNALSDWRLQGDSTLAFNNGPNFEAVIRSLSGGPDTKLQVGAGTTLNVFTQGDGGTFSGTLAGDGTLVKSGAGTLTLQEDGAPAFAGTVHVQQGSLIYEHLNPFSDGFALAFAAILLLDDAAFAALDGTVGEIDSEGTLAPGGDGTPGTLNVTSNMTLGATSHLEFDLGAPTGSPGIDSDVINVGGNVTLDGALDVADNGGRLGIGLYRLINYGGALTDNGLDIGVVPDGFTADDLTVRTSTAGQVNLVVGEIPEIGFFDDDEDGVLSNGNFDLGTKIVFQSTITTGGGLEVPVSLAVDLGAPGVQFFDDGISLVPADGGGSLNLVGPDATQIDVGDGTAAGAAITATIGVDIAGLGGLNKTGLGTLVLTGNNTYTGGTTIANGTLQVHDTASIPGDVEILEPGTLLLELTGIDQTLSGSISGQGTTVKTGTGSLTVRQEGESTYTGTVRVDEGTLRFVGGFQSQLSVAGILLIDENAFANIFGGGTAVVGEVAIEGGGGLTVGQDTTLQVGTLNTAASSVVVIEEESILEVIDGFLSGELATPDGLFRVSGLVTLAGDTSGFQGVIDILSGGTLILDLAEDGAFGGTVTGSGNAVKDGEGTLDLLGLGFDSAFSGGITVAAGNLRGDSDSLNGDIVVLSGGRLTFNQATNGAFTGTISGAGPTVKDGAGDLAAFFVFDPAYTGGVTVAAGSLRGDAGSLPDTIDILSGGTLVFDQSSNASYSGTPTGTGAIAKQGGGTLTLEVDSGWSRVLTLDVREGETRVLVTEADGSARFKTVTIANGAGLTLAPGTTVGAETLTGAGGSKVTLADGSVLVLEAGDSIVDEIEGEGMLEVRGNVTLAGDSPNFNGDIDLRTGKVTIRAFLGSTADIEERPNGRIKAGEGTGLAGFGFWLGEVVLESGATVSPGESIGTLSAGAVTFAPGSILEVEVDDAGNSDLLAVTGAAALNGGIVRVLAENRTDDGSTYAADTQYVILTAGGGVTGTFDEVTEDFAFLSASLTYGADRVTLSLTRDGLADFCIAGATANQCAVGEGVDSLGTGALFGAVLMLSETAAPGAFDALSGEIHASLPTMLLEDSRFPREAAIARLRTAFGAGGPAIAERPVSERFSFWGQAFGAWGDRDGDGNAARLDRSIGGFAMGGDALVGDAVRIGLFGGYTQADYDVDARASSGSADTLHLGVYGGGQWGGFGLRAGGAYAWHDIEVGRAVTFPGFSDSLSAAYDARTLQGFAEAGYRFGAGATAIEPFTGVAHVSVRSDGFGENGGPAALVSAQRTRDATFTTLGLRAETALGLGTANIGLSGMAGWRHAFGDIGASGHRFTSGGAAFAVAGTPLAEDILVLEAALDAQIAPGATIGLGYSGQFGSGLSDHGANAHFVVRF